MAARVLTQTLASLLKMTPRIFWMVVVLMLLTLTTADKAPRFKACKRNQAPDKLNHCVRDSIQKAFPELVKGLPDYGVDTIDPLRVDELEVPKSENNAAVKVDISFKHLDISGLGNANIKSVEVNVDKYWMKAKVDIPGSVTLRGDYTVNGKVLLLPVFGSGLCNITLENPRCEVTEMQARSSVKAGKEYVRVTSLKFVVLDTDRLHIQLDNLFNGNKLLGENMNMVLNDNWREIFKDMMGPVQAALGESFRSIINKVIKKVPYSALFP